MGCDCYKKQTDYGPAPYIENIQRVSMQNSNFRTALWTGCHLQMTLMCLPPCTDIGLELHPDTDQFIRIEHGRAFITLGTCKNHPDSQQYVCQGDSVFIPAGTWHNVMNVGKTPLKLSSIYAPPNHARGTVHRTKADAEHESSD